MRIVFIGASKFGARCLNELLDISGIEVVGAVTAPQKFSISYNPQGVTNVLHADIASVCENKGIPVTLMTNGMNDNGLISVVRAWKADAFIVSGWYHMVTKKWMEMAPAYGLHASLLPDYSGGAPLVWAIINGEKKTGITFFRFDSGVDSGDIVAQSETPIYDDDTIKTVYARIEDLGLSLLKQFMPQLANNTAKLIKQDHTKRRIVPQRGPEDGLIDWNNDAEKIYNFVRAQTKPYPGAFMLIDGKKATIWAVTPSTFVSGLPSDIINQDDKIIIVCGGNTAVEIVSLSVDGKDCSLLEFFIPLSKKVA